MSDFQNVGSSHLTVMASSGKYQIRSEILDLGEILDPSLDTFPFFVIFRTSR